MRPLEESEHGEHSAVVLFGLGEAQLGQAGLPHQRRVTGQRASRKVSAG
jgi:hypothetical protein